MMRKGQASFEYGVLIFAVVLAMLAMRAYINRSIQGRLKQAADELGQQYDPRHTSSDMTLVQSGTTTTTTNTIVTAANREEVVTISTVNGEREWHYGTENVEILPAY